MRVQRLRVQFGRGERLKYITHLDLMRFWERALRRAEIPVAYSEGFSPHPQISLAAPLPVGVVSSAELMDVFLSRQLDAAWFRTAVSRQTSPGLTILGVDEAAMAQPSLQSLMRAAEYRVCFDPVCFEGATERESLQSRIDAFLASATIPWQQQREKEIRHYDLRPLVQQLALDVGTNGLALSMRLQADNAATGRPDQVLAALGLSQPAVIERIALILDAPEDGLDAEASQDAEKRMET